MAFNTDRLKNKISEVSNPSHVVEDDSDNFLSGLANAVFGNNQARYEMQDLMEQQMRAYREQTELTREEINRKRNEQASEKRRIQEKQIRSLRRNYRPAGMLGVGAPASEDMSSQLGS